MQKLFFIFFTFFVLACTKEIAFNIEPLPPQIVLNCFFTQDSAWQVRLYESASPQGSSITKEIKNAAIEIYEDGKFLTSLSRFLDKKDQFRQNTGYYTEPVGSLHPPKVAHTYTIKVKAKGFPDVSATETLLELPIAEKFQYSIDEKFEGKLSCELIKDKKHSINYYGARIVSEATVKPTNGFITSDYVPKEDTSYWHFSSPNLDNLPFYPPGQYIFKGTNMFPDTLLKGTPHKIQSEFTPYYIRLSPPKEIYFDLLHISPACYNYAISFEKQVVTANDPFSEAKIVFNNIEGGFGIFAAYSVKRFTIKP